MKGKRRSYTLAVLLQAPEGNDFHDAEDTTAMMGDDGEIDVSLPLQPWEPKP